MNEELVEYLHILETAQRSYTRIDHMRRTIERLIIYLGDSEQISSWPEVTEDELIRFIIKSATTITYRGKQPAYHSLVQWVSCLRSFFSWLQSEGHILVNPAEHLQMARRESTTVRALAEAEIVRLIEAAPLDTACGLRDRALMETFYATGIRLREVYKLELYDVDTTSRRLIVREGKGGYDRIIPLTQQAAKWIDQYLLEARPVLAAGYKYKKPTTSTVALWLSAQGRRLDLNMINARIAKYARQVGLKATAHTFRHSFATHLLRNGARVQDIQRLLGHQGLEVTKLYTHVEIADLKRIMKEANLDTNNV